MIPLESVYQYDILIACECSGKIREAFTARGHTAISADLKPTKIPGPHYQGDVRDIDIKRFKLVIAHPPCHAIGTTAGWKYAGTPERDEAIKFFMHFWDRTTDRQMVCIENTVGIMNTMYPSTRRLVRPYYIQPYQHGHPLTKKTGLWTRNLPELKPTRILIPHEANSINNITGEGEELRELRSETFTGVANAMADQWGELL